MSNLPRRLAALEERADTSTPESVHCIVVAIGQAESEAREEYFAANPEVPADARFILLQTVDGRLPEGGEP